MRSFGSHVSDGRLQGQCDTTSGVIRRQVERLDRDTTLEAVEAFQHDFLRRERDPRHIDAECADCSKISIRKAGECGNSLPVRFSAEMSHSNSSCVRSTYRTTVSHLARSRQPYDDKPW